MKKELNIKELKDKDLINLYTESQNKKFVGELYKRYTRFVFLISMKYLKDEAESQDAVMHIFEKLFTDLNKHEITNFKPWLHTVTRNHCLMKLRGEQFVIKKKLEYKKDYQNFMETESEFHHIDENNSDGKIEILQNAVNDLNPEQKKCVSLFYLQEKTYEEVVNITGFTFKQVKSYIQNGKRNLKIKLSEAGISAIIILFVYQL